jgi:cytochrome c oxidase cbb3-type subunit 1
VGNFIINWVPGGISRVNVNFFYVHNLVGLIFTPMGLATAYYFLPKLTNTPIYSHKLSMIGFWSIAFVYAWVGSHHIIHGPMSQWLQTVAIIFSIWLFIPVWTVVANLFATMHGVWRKYSESVPVRFLLMGNLFYLMVSTQGSFMALRNVNEITSKTDWIIAHAHLSLLGTFTFFAIAGIYGILPILTKRPLWSDKLAQWHWKLSFLGAMLMFFALHVGGFLQGLQWASWADGNSYRTFHSNLSKLPFLQTVADMHYWWVLRSFSGLMLLTGNILFLVNVYNTVVLEPPAGVRRPQKIAVKV